MAIQGHHDEAKPPHFLLQIEEVLLGICSRYFLLTCHDVKTKYRAKYRCEANTAKKALDRTSLKGSHILVEPATQATFLISTKILSIHDNSRQTHDNSRHLTTPHDNAHDNAHDLPTTSHDNAHDKLTTPHDNAHDIPRQDALKCPDSSRHTHDILTTNSRQLPVMLTIATATMTAITKPASPPPGS
eukprot:scaffold44959_cov39-Cyclotella_meneghiniana.AAC.2